MTSPLRTLILPVVAAAVGVVVAGAGVVHSEEPELTSALTLPGGALEDAAESLARDVADDPRDAVAWRDLGVVHTRLGRYEEAREAFGRAEELLPDDPYLQGYAAISAEMLGDDAAAAARYEALAGQLEREETELSLRARLLRLRLLLRDVEVSSPLEAPSTVSVLSPQDLGHSAPELGERIAELLRGALVRVPDVASTGPDAARHVLVSDGRSLDDLDDEERADLAGASLHAGGIEALLVTSYYREEEGDVRYRIALLSTGEKGLAEPVSLRIPVGTAGGELLPLREAVRQAAEALGRSVDEEELRRAIPPSLELADRWASVRQAMDEGKIPQALASLEELAQSGGWRPAHAEALDDLHASDEVLEEPLAARLGDPEPVIELLRREARRMERRNRRFDDL